MSPSGPRPTIGGLLSLMLVVLLAIMVWRAAAATEAASGPPRTGPACAEQQRLERLGVHSGASYRRAQRACRAELAAP